MECTARDVSPELSESTVEVSKGLVRHEVLGCPFNNFVSKSADRCPKHRKILSIYVQD